MPPVTKGGGTAWAAESTLAPNGLYSVTSTTAGTLTVTLQSTGATGQLAGLLDFRLDGINNPAAGATMQMTVAATGAATPSNFQSIRYTGSVADVKCVYRNSGAGPTNLLVAYSEVAALPVGGTITVQLSAITAVANIVASPAITALDGLLSGTTFAASASTTTNAITVTIVTGGAPAGAKLRFHIAVVLPETQSSCGVSTSTTPLAVQANPVIASAVANLFTASTASVLPSLPQTAAAVLTLTFTSAAVIPAGGSIFVYFPIEFKTNTLPIGLVTGVKCFLATNTAVNLAGTDGSFDGQVLTLPVLTQMSVGPNSCTVPLTTPVTGSYMLTLDATGANSAQSLDGSTTRQLLVVSGGTVITEVSGSFMNNTPTSLNIKLTVSFKDGGALGANSVVTITIPGLGATTAGVIQTSQGSVSATPVVTSSTAVVSSATYTSTTQQFKITLASGAAAGTLHSFVISIATSPFAAFFVPTVATTVSPVGVAMPGNGIPISGTISALTAVGTGTVAGRFQTLTVTFTNSVAMTVGETLTVTMTQRGAITLVSAGLFDPAGAATTWATTAAAVNTPTPAVLAPLTGITRLFWLRQLGAVTFACGDTTNAATNALCIGAGPTATNVGAFITATFSMTAGTVPAGTPLSFTITGGLDMQTFTNLDVAVNSLSSMAAATAPVPVGAIAYQAFTATFSVATPAAPSVCLLSFTAATAFAAGSQLAVYMPGFKNVFPAAPVLAFAAAPANTATPVAPFFTAAWSNVNEILTLTAAGTTVNTNGNALVIPVSVPMNPKAGSYFLQAWNNNQDGQPVSTATASVFLDNVSGVSVTSSSSVSNAPGVTMTVTFQTSASIAPGTSFSLALTTVTGGIQNYNSDIAANPTVAALNGWGFCFLDCGCLGLR